MGAYFDVDENFMLDFVSEVGSEKVMKSESNNFEINIICSFNPLITEYP